ncbi:MAG: ATP-dependent DNA helicase RecG [Gammaproteobacteria bacterium]|nr:ATP-dependent DNA helicase RecG [Gammaproteobacteria bacterium]
MSAPTRDLPGVGPKIEDLLKRIGIHCLRDLLFHLPYRYADRTRLLPIGALQSGVEALTQGRVELCQVRYPGRRSLLCRISDGTGALTLRFFHFNRAQEAQLQRGALIRCYGLARRSATTVEMIHPEYQKLNAEQPAPLEQTLTPVYPATEGLSQGRLRRLTTEALAAMRSDAGGLEEIIPASLLRDLGMPLLREALEYVHRPPPDADTALMMQGRHPCQQRLAFEELLAHILSLRVLRSEVRAQNAPPLNPPDNRLSEAMIGALPFALTLAQQRVMAQVRADLSGNRPMMRLLQGDVGSGKTVVAAFAAVQAVASGYQVAFMAPTELLAGQHFLNLGQWLSALEIEVILMSAQSRGSGRGECLARMRDGAPLVAVGTHALFQEQVKFGRLGLVIIDEQHRFGVHQRLALLRKGESGESFPHQLIMTATPIPRTLAMTLFADLDLSVIDELPPGRQSVRTVVVSNVRRGEVIDRVAEACRAGRQVYWVCPLIAESEVLQCQAAIETRAALQEQFPHLSIGLLHGRLQAREKERGMQQFRSGAQDILVATTVIEVGVDVPNASLMVIENAERLGLAQLHQLRGRVGRGRAKSDCVLLYQPPLSGSARARMETMRRTTDGFAIAEKDLQLRGAGELLGARQTGLQGMRIASFERDARMIPRARKVADALVERHPQAVEPLVRRWVMTEAGIGSV